MTDRSEARKKAIEATLRRHLGPSEAQRAKIKAIASEPVWRVKCRNCGTYNEGVRLNALPSCEHCGAPLGHRPNP